MAATFIFLSALRTNTPSCIDLAMATLISASRAEMKEGREQKMAGGGRKKIHRIVKRSDGGKKINKIMTEMERRGNKELGVNIQRLRWYGYFKRM